MKITLEEKFRYGDFSFDKQEDMLSYVKSVMADDADFIETLRMEAKEELEIEEQEYDQKKVEEMVKDKLEERAEKAIASVRIYAEYDIEY